MISTSRLLSLSIALTTTSQILGYAYTGLWFWAGLILILGVLWIKESKQQRDWTASLFLIGFLGTAAGGVYQKGAAGWMLLSVIGTFTAWDVQHFTYKLQFAPSAEAVKKLEAAHFRRLLIVNCVGFALAGIPLMVTLNITFGTILFLTAFAIVFLSRVILFIRRQSD